MEVHTLVGLLGCLSSSTLNSLSDVVGGVPMMGVISELKGRYECKVELELHLEVTHLMVSILKFVCVMRLFEGVLFVEVVCLD